MEGGYSLSSALPAPKKNLSARQAAIATATAAVVGNHSAGAAATAAAAASSANAAASNRSIGFLSGQSATAAADTVISESKQGVDGASKRKGRKKPTAEEAPALSPHLPSSSSSSSSSLSNSLGIAITDATTTITLSLPGNKVTAKASQPPQPSLPVTTYGRVGRGKNKKYTDDTKPDAPPAIDGRAREEVFREDSGAGDASTKEDSVSAAGAVSFPDDGNESFLAAKLPLNHPTIPSAIISYAAAASQGSTSVTAPSPSSSSVPSGTPSSGQGSQHPTHHTHPTHPPLPTPTPKTQKTCKTRKPRQNR